MDSLQRSIRRGGGSPITAGGPAVLLAAAPNTETLIWVDFSVQDVLPPDPSKEDRVPLKRHR